MMKIYICPDCGWIRVVSRRKDVECHRCGQRQMRLTNLDLEKFSGMTEQERRDYADGWIYIHSRAKS
jgi:Zn-finger nucleic acid-binding protein